MKKLSSVLALLLTAACVAGEKIGGLHEGMSPDEVIGVMGRPNGFERAEDISAFQYTNRLITGWNWDRADYYAVFKDDHLIKWGSGQVRVETQHNVGTLFIVPLKAF